MLRWRRHSRLSIAIGWTLCQHALQLHCSHVLVAEILCLVVLIHEFVHFPLRKHWLLVHVLVTESLYLGEASFFRVLWRLRWGLLVDDSRFTLARDGPLLLMDRASFEWTADELSEAGELSEAVDLQIVIMRARLLQSVLYYHLNVIGELLLRRIRWKCFEYFLNCFHVLSFYRDDLHVVVRVHDLCGLMWCDDDLGHLLLLEYLFPYPSLIDMNVFLRWRFLSSRE